MSKPRILATGKTGSVVVAELLEAGYPVRAMVHRKDGRGARLKAQGAEIAVADMSDVESLADALQDVQRAYFCPPYDPYMIQGRGRLCDRCQGSRPRTHRWPDSMAGEPFPSLAHDAPALAGRPAVLDDARSYAYDREPGLLRWRLPGDDWVVFTSRHLSLDVRQFPQRNTLERGYRAGRGRGDGSGAHTPGRATATPIQSSSGRRTWPRRSAGPLGDRSRFYRHRPGCS